MKAEKYYPMGKDYICIDTDGYLSTPNGRLWNCHINDPRRIRRMRRYAWIDKHPLLTFLMYGLPTLIMIGGLVFAIITTPPPTTEELNWAEAQHLYDPEPPTTEWDGP